MPGFSGLADVVLQRTLEQPCRIDYALLSEILKASAHLSIRVTEHWLEHGEHLPLIVNITPQP